jgi:hypothetical protein
MELKRLGCEAEPSPPPAEVKLYVLCLTCLHGIELHQAQKQLYSLHTRVTTHDDNNSVQRNSDNEIRIISSCLQKNVVM